MKQDNQKTTNLVLLCEKVHNAEKATYYTNFYLCVTTVKADDSVKVTQIPIKVNSNSYKALRYLNRVLELNSEIVTRDYDKKD